MGLKMLTLGAVGGPLPGSGLRRLALAAAADSIAQAKNAIIAAYSRKDSVVTATAR
jgi:hypothetical protein